MPARSIIVGLGADVARLRKDFDSARKDVRKFTSSAESSFKALGVAIGGYISYRVISAGIRQVSSVIADVTRLAGEEELAQKKLATALGFTSQALIDQAAALQQTTAYGDDAVVGAMALIAAFTKSEAATSKATEATLDLASGAGMDLNAAASLVSKTLGSTTNALQRYGISVEGAVGSSERLESLTKNISKVFGGQAAAEAETYSGKVKQIANAWGDAKEEMGRAFTENNFLIGSMGLVKKAIESMGSSMKTNKEAMQEFVKSGILIATDALILLVKAADKFAAAYRTIGMFGVGLAAAYKAFTEGWTKEDAELLKEFTANAKAKGQVWDSLIAKAEELRAKMAATPTGVVTADIKVKGKGFSGIGEQGIEAANKEYEARKKLLESEASEWASWVDEKLAASSKAAQEEWELTQSVIAQENDAWVALAEDRVEADYAAAQAISKNMKDLHASVITLTDDLAAAFSYGLGDMREGIADLVMTGKTNFRDMADSMIRDIIRVIAQWAIIAPLTGGIGSALGMKIPVPMLAAGGPVSAGRPYIVGEKGPELFVPSSSGSVVPNGAGGSPVVNIINQSGTPVSGRASSRNDAGNWVIDVVLDGVNRNVRGLRTALAGA